VSHQQATREYDSGSSGLPALQRDDA
jgi:hypothetical protein